MGRSVVVVVAGLEVGIDHARDRLLPQPQRRAAFPKARRTDAADLSCLAVSPDIEHVDGAMLIGLSGAE